MISIKDYIWGHIGIDGWVSCMADSAGGVSVKLSVENYGKPVKKYNIYFKAYNGANELVECTVRNSSVQVVGSADFIGTGMVKRDLIFENAWYNHSIRHVEIDKIEVVYYDGTTETCLGNHYLSEEEKKQKEISEQKRKDWLRAQEINNSTDDFVGGIISIIVLVIMVVVIYALGESLLNDLF